MKLLKLVAIAPLVMLSTQAFAQGGHDGSRSRYDSRDRGRYDSSYRGSRYSNSYRTVYAPRYRSSGFRGSVAIYSNPYYYSDPYYAYDPYYSDPYYYDSYYAPVYRSYPYYRTRPGVSIGFSIGSSRGRYVAPRRRR